VEFFFTLDNSCHYFNPGENRWTEFAFDDENKTIKAYDVASTEMAGFQTPDKVFSFDEDQYEKVKFLFLNYFTKSNHALDATEVWEDRERILRQSAQVLAISRTESDLRIEERELNLRGIAAQNAMTREQVEEMERRQKVISIDKGKIIQ